MVNGEGEVWSMSRIYLIMAAIVLLVSILYLALFVVKRHLLYRTPRLGGRVVDASTPRGNNMNDWRDHNTTRRCIPRRYAHFKYHVVKDAAPRMGQSSSFHGIMTSPTGLRFLINFQNDATQLAFQ